MSQAKRTMNGKEAQTARDLLDETSQLRSELAALAASSQRTVRDWRRYVKQRVEDQPYATVLVAAGFGYVLGGGLPTSLVRVALGIGSRLAAERVLAQVAHTLFENKNT
jgi:hypothetical protein